MSRHDAVPFICAVALTSVIGSVIELRAALQPAQFRAQTALVRLDVLATKRGVPVQGLGKADFAIDDNGVPQVIDTVLSASVPLHLCLVLDRSQSVDGRPFANLKRAVQSIAVGLASEDRVSLIGFGARVTLLARATNSPATIASAIDRLRAEGGSSLRDALFAATRLCTGGNQRSAVLVFSDGRDTTSWLTEPMLGDALSRSSVVIYAITVEGEQSTGNVWAHAARKPGYEFLRHVSTSTGGRLVRARRVELDAAADSVLAELRARYLISYYPRGVPSAGYHKIKVSLTHRRGDVSVRRGYLVGDSACPRCPGSIEYRR